MLNFLKNIFTPVSVMVYLHDGVPVCYWPSSDEQFMERVPGILLASGLAWCWTASLGDSTQLAQTRREYLVLNSGNEALLRDDLTERDEVGIGNEVFIMGFDPASLAVPLDIKQLRAEYDLFVSYEASSIKVIWNQIGDGTSSYIWVPTTPTDQVAALIDSLELRTGKLRYSREKYLWTASLKEQPKWFFNDLVVSGGGGKFDVIR